VTDIDMKVPPGWHYLPVAPFRVITTDMQRFVMHQYEFFDTFDEALQAFIAGVMPIRPWWGATVTDRDDYVVLAHNSCPHWELHWIGVRAAFDDLAACDLMDPIDIELIAIEAELPWRTDD
jgi:hypothetical protein